MSELATFRRTLQAVGRRRRRARLLRACETCAAVLVLGALTYYLIDRRLMLNAAARTFADVVLAGAVGWVAWRGLRPAWRAREDEIDGALRLERALGIGADLVAALEFDAARNRGALEAYGSAQLACALVDEVAVAPPPIDVRAEVRAASPPTAGRIALRVVALVVLAAAAYHWRDVRTLVERMLLGAAHYPSRTRLDRLSVNERDVTVGPHDAATRLVVPVGRPVSFELQVSGVVPSEAVVELIGAEGASLLELTRDEGAVRSFAARLPALVENVAGRVVAGDAFGRTFELVAAELPRIVVAIEVRPPDYAEGVVLPQPPPGRLNIAVLEGSDVAVGLVAANKRLRRATIVLGGRTFDLTATDAERRSFRLAPGAASELTGVRQPLEFQIQVEDDDGFALPEVLRGEIALRPDQPPSVAAEVVTKFILPTGKPTISYQAGDDLGIRSLAVVRQVVRTDGTTANDRVEIPWTVVPEGAPAVSATAPSGRFSLPLADLQLAKGDKVTIRVEARDRRDDAGRTPAQSEPFTLEVTDEQGLYEAMAETDQRSARKMDEIIQKQLLMTGRPATLSPVASPTGGGARPASTAGPPPARSVPAPAAGTPAERSPESPSPAAPAPTGSQLPPPSVSLGVEP